MSVCALVTLYHPDDATRAFWRKASGWFDHIFLCDNTNDNRGIPAAYNRVLRTYDFRDDDLIMFFDQDTRFGRSFVTKMQSAYIQAQNALVQDGRKLGALGPVFYNRSRGKIEIPTVKTVVRDCDGAPLFLVNSAITSALTMRCGVLREIGMWNEDLFLDFTDWDLCFRIKAAGYQIAMTPRVAIEHAVGEGDVKLGAVHIRKSTPAREYYMARDSRYLLSRPYTPLQYRRKLLQMAFLEPWLHCILFDDKATRFYAVCKGIADYHRHVTGRSRM